jgi:hypothetical protein
MSCCATERKRIEIGTHGHCDKLTIPVTVSETGVYLAEWEYNGAIIYREITLIEGENLRIDCSWFNEDSDNIIKFYDSSGNSIGLSEPNPITTLCEFIDEFRLIVKPKFKFQDKATCLKKLLCSDGEECMNLVMTAP